MLSISGMLGPSSPVTQRPSWYDGSSERVSESEERHFSSTPEAGTMPRPQERKGLQSLLNAAASPEPSSPEEPFRPASYRRSFSEEVCVTSAPHPHVHLLRKELALTSRELLGRSFIPPKSVSSKQEAKVEWYQWRTDLFVKPEQICYQLFSSSKEKTSTPSAIHKRARRFYLVLQRWPLNVMAESCWAVQ